MTVRLIVFALLLSKCFTGFAADAVKLETRRFEVLPGLLNVIHDQANPDGVRNDETFMTTSDMEDDLQTYKSFFLDMGVTWPEDSEIDYLSAISQLRVTNTAENIDRLQNILVMANLTPCMIDIRVDFVEYDLNDIDKLARDDNISNESLQALWKKGDARLLSSGRTLTKNGQEAVVRGVTEYIYPTEFDVRPRLALNKTTRDKTTATVEPQNFEMMEVGAILQFVAEISAESNCNFINLLLNPQLTSPPEWKDYGNGRNLNMQQPFFHAYSVSTQITVGNGETILLGGGMNNEAGDKTVYAFLTATIVDTEGQPVPIEDSKDSN